MATFRSTFASAVAAAFAAATPPVTWPIVDAVNTTDVVDASQGSVTLEFLGGSEEPYSFGQPGSNWFLESGQVTIKVMPPLGSDRDEAERILRVLRDYLRGATLQISGGSQIRVDGIGMLGGGFDDAGMWIESLGVSYTMIVNI